MPEDGFTLRSHGLLLGLKIVLDLGTVDDIAEVSVNGKSIATLWKPPYKLDVTDALKAGDNQIEIKVTNEWNNRIMGDRPLPAGKEDPHPRPGGIRQPRRRWSGNAGGFRAARAGHGAFRFIEIAIRLAAKDRFMKIKTSRAIALVCGGRFVRMHTGAPSPAASSSSGPPAGEF